MDYDNSKIRLGRALNVVRKYAGHEKGKRKKTDSVLPRHGLGCHGYVFQTKFQKPLYMEKRYPRVKHKESN